MEIMNNDTIYLAYKSKGGKNILFGRVLKDDVEKFKSEYPELSLIKTDMNNVEDEEKAMSAVVNRKGNKITQKTIKRKQKKSKAYNYNLIPDGMYDEIKKSVEKKDYDKLDKLRKKYEVADKCPSCMDFKGWLLRLWNNYLEVKNV